MVWVVISTTHSQSSSNHMEAPKGFRFDYHFPPKFVLLFEAKCRHKHTENCNALLELRNPMIIYIFINI